MKKFFLVFAVLLSVSAMSQTVKLACPLTDAVMKNPTGDYNYDGNGDWKMLVVSKSDSFVKAGFDGKIRTVAKGDGKTYDIVMYSGNHYIWYVGVDAAMVRERDVVKKGQTIAVLAPGNDLEVMLFNKETPMMVKNHLECAAGN